MPLDMSMKDISDAFVVDNEAFNTDSIIGMSSEDRSGITSSRRGVEASPDKVSS